MSDSRQSSLFPAKKPVALNPSAHDTPKIAVVGGGISGLTAAYRIVQQLPSAEIHLYESSDRLGGVLETRQEGPLLIERGADSFLNKIPAAEQLCAELGLTDELIPTARENRRALILRENRLHRVPEGFVILKPQRLGPLLSSSLLSWEGKLRACCEGWVPPAEGISSEAYDESVASFATRRLGREAFEWLVQPLLSGIYTADPRKLSLAATMPEAIAAEREHGSLRAAMRAARKTSTAHVGTNKDDSGGVRYAQFLTLQTGLQRLVESLTARLGRERIQTRCGVTRCQRTTEGRWKLQFSARAEEHVDAVVLALPAVRAAGIVAIGPLGDLLRRIPYASSAVLTFVASKQKVARGLDGFGIVVPQKEGRRIIAASFSSLKFAHRAPDDQLLIRVFVGGALQAELVEWPDHELVSLAEGELSALLGFSQPPTLVDLVRWREKMPQYHVGHPALVREIEAQVSKLPGFELAGNAYHGVGIPQCIASGNQAAQRIAAYLSGETRQRSLRPGDRIHSAR